MIVYQIDHDRRLVVAQGRGVLTGQDIFEYQREVWSRPDVAGYSELVDMTAVERIDMASTDRIRELAFLSASMDPPSSRSRFAIVAPTDEAFGLGRMYQAYRRMEDRTTKEVSVFRSLEDAMAFLGVEGDPPSPRPP